MYQSKNNFNDYVKKVKKVWTLFGLGKVASYHSIVLNVKTGTKTGQCHFFHIFVNKLCEIIRNKYLRIRTQNPESGLDVIPGIGISYILRNVD